jgi:CheB methylesterase
MTVLQATDGMPVEREHLYVIPPGNYLSIVDGALHLSQPQAHHGAGLQFDFLLRSMATACGTRAICVILSGTGADRSLGLGSVKEKGGLVIARDTGKLLALREGCGQIHRRADSAAASGHGDGSCRPSQRERRRGSRHQQTHSRKPSSLDHDEDRYQITAGLARLALRQ